jgi:hypothetical protein
MWHASQAPTWPKSDGEIVHSTIEDRRKGSKQPTVSGRGTRRMVKTKDDDEEQDGEMAYAFDKGLLHFDLDRLRRNPSIAFTDNSIRRRSLWHI